MLKNNWPILLMTLVWSCANPVSPTGGPRDVRPPALDTMQSTPDQQTFFSERQISLTFDEWIQLDNIYGQLVISPPLEFRPEIKAKGKTMTFTFDEREQLRDSVTYTINFGASIKDNTEGNKVSDLRFVFSTGPFIDSLTFDGTVVDAYTSTPVADLPVLLFRRGGDSIVFHEKPLYFCTTNDQGLFRFQNLREGTYRILALEDGNNNLQLDLDTEGVGFIDSLVFVSDSNSGPVRIEYSVPFKYEAYTTVQYKDSIGVAIGFTGPVSGLEILNGADLWHELVNDTLFVRATSKRAWPDTLYIRQLDRIDSIAINNEKVNLSPFRTIRFSGTAPVSPKHRIRLTFDQPVRSFDTSAIRLYDTSSAALPISLTLDSNSQRTILIDAPLRSQRSYELAFLPGALVRWNNIPSADTLSYPVNVGNTADFGDLLLDITGLRKDVPYLAGIIFGNDRVVYEEQIHSSDGSYSLVLPGMTPGNYSMRITEDTNENKKWDPGNYWKGLQAENTYLIPLGELRANWELKLEVPVPADN